MVNDGEDGNGLQYGQNQEMGGKHFQVGIGFLGNFANYLLEHGIPSRKSFL